MMMNADYSLWVALPTALAVAALCGGTCGVLIAYVGMPPFVVTLGMMSLARSMAMVMSNNTMVFDFGRDHAKFIGLGGGSTRQWFDSLAGSLGPDSALGGVAVWLAVHVNIPNPAITLALFALIFGFAFRWTRWGRHIFAIGGNEQAAEMTGVPVRRIKVSVYVLSALCAGIAGILQVGWLGTITTGMGTGMELIVIAAVVIGGANLMGGSGTAFGAVVGAALIEIIRNSLTLLGINPFWQGTFVGTFIIVAVLFDRIREHRETVMRAAKAIADAVRGRRDSHV
jgi:ribose transport system permease protein